jgi:hypothetical protein
MAMEKAGLIMAPGMTDWGNDIATKTGSTSETDIKKAVEDAMNKVYDDSVKAGFITGEVLGKATSKATSSELKQYKIETEEAMNAASDRRLLAAKGKGGLIGHSGNVASAQSKMDTFLDKYKDSGKRLIYGKPSGVSDKKARAEYDKIDSEITAAKNGLDTALSEADYKEYLELKNYITINK